MTESANLGTRAERTRAALLAAAEVLFAERGFAATRLEDVAERVGIRRASIVYYYRDKRELYDAVLADVFTGLYERIEAALSGSGPRAERIEAGVSAWVDYVGARPTFARLLLREVADATTDRREALLRLTAPFADLVRTQVYDRRTPEDPRLNEIDPVHMASAIAGATVFFVAATPTLVPELAIDPLSPEQLDAHRDEVLRIVRRLLGTRGPRSASA